MSNRKAFHDYHIIERYEAGISLLGSEVKAIRAGKIQIKDAWVDISQHDEAYLKQATILRLPHMIFQHDPERVRKLLLKKNEIARLNTRRIGKIKHLSRVAVFQEIESASGM